MEILFFLLILLVYIFGFSGVFRGAQNITKASVKTFTEGGSIVGNLKEEFREMGSFEAQLVKTKVKVGEGYEDAYEVNIRGLIPVPKPTSLVFVTSLFDFTSKEYEYILCALDFHQEKATRSFQQVIEAGVLSPNQGYKNWVKVATFYPNTLTAKMSGQRIVRALVRAMPPDEVSKIELGLHEKDTNIFATATIDSAVNFIEKGWMESRRERQSAMALIVQIAVGFANIGRQMTEEEGREIQKWVRSQVDGCLEEDKETVKEQLNSSLKEAYQLTSSALFSFSGVLEKLSPLGFNALNKELMELLIRIMNLSPSNSSEKMNTIKLIGEALNISYEVIKAMTEKAFLDSNSMPATEQSLEGLLGIDESWSKEEINAHLRKEFAKWNGRIQSLEDEDEKNKAQMMLDAVAAARKKYG